MKQCSSCKKLDELDNLLRVTSVATGRRFYVHRPTLGNDYASCFRYGVQGPEDHRIEATR